MNTLFKTLLVILSVFIIAFGIYYFLSHKRETDNAISYSIKNNSAVDTKTFIADDQGGNLTFKYPTDFVATENSDGFITIKNTDGNIVADLTAVTGSAEDNVNYIVNPAHHWFRIAPTKTKVKTKANLVCTDLVGTFDNKVGSFNSHPDNSHMGQSGSIYVCEKPFVLDFYTNNDQALNSKLNLILDTLK